MRYLLLVNLPGVNLEYFSIVLSEKGIFDYGGAAFSVCKYRESQYYQNRSPYPCTLTVDLKIETLAFSGDFLS